MNESRMNAVFKKPGIKPRAIKMACYLLVFFYLTTETNAAAVYAVSSGSWSSAIWASTINGTPGSASVPAATDDVYINASIAVTADQSISINSLDLSGSLAMNSYDLTLTGSYNKQSGGSITSSANIIFSGTATQTITDLSTAGNIRITKTAGTVTASTAITANTLLVNQSGGTFNGGSSLSHTLTTITVSAGTLNLSSSTLAGSSTNLSISGGTFNAGTATYNVNDITLSGGTLNANSSTFTILGTFNKTQVRLRLQPAQLFLAKVVTKPFRTT